MQGADGSGGSALGAGLQPLAQQHQRDHHGRARNTGAAPCRAGACSHSHTDSPSLRWCRWPPAGPCCRCSASTACQPAFVETRAQDELHRRGQHELQPGRQHPVQAQPGRRPWVVPGQRQQCRPKPPARSPPRARRPPGAGWRQGCAVRTRHHAPHALSAPASGRRRHRARLMRARFGGQVHGGVLHAGHFFRASFDTAHARCAGHAADAQVQVAAWKMEWCSWPVSLNLSTMGRSSGIFAPPWRFDQTTVVRFTLCIQDVSHALIGEPTMNQTFTVTGMTCGHCERAVTQAVQQPGGPSGPGGDRPRPEPGAGAVLPTTGEAGRRHCRRGHAVAD